VVRPHASGKFSWIVGTLVIAGLNGSHPSL